VTFPVAGGAVGEAATAVPAVFVLETALVDWEFFESGVDLCEAVVDVAVIFFAAELFTHGVFDDVALGHIDGGVGKIAVADGAGVLVIAADFADGRDGTGFSA